MNPVIGICIHGSSGFHGLLIKQTLSMFPNLLILKKYLY